MIDWERIVEHNREALRRILLALVAMAGLASPPTLPRHLYRAVLRLLRPAEAAARRLIIAAARGLVVTLPPPRKPKPLPVHADYVVIALHGGVRSRLVWKSGAQFPSITPLPPKSAPARLAFPLFDPLRTPFRPRRTYVPEHAAPRISSLDGGRTPPPVRPLPMPDDPIDVKRLRLRLAGLGHILDDLPRQAKRFARWRARRAAGLVERFSPLRPGYAYGVRRPRSRRRAHEIDEVLKNLHYFAHEALKSPDTS